MPSIAELLNQQQKAFDESRAANESRYAEILVGYTERQAQYASTVRQAYETGAAKVSAEFAANQAKAQQSAAGRGLGSLTGAVGQIANADQPYVQQGMAARYDQMSKLGTIQHEVERSQFKEDRTDQYPDVQLYANVLQKLGEAEAEQRNYDRNQALQNAQNAGNRGYDFQLPQQNPYSVASLFGGYSGVR